MEERKRRTFQAAFHKLRGRKAQSTLRGRHKDGLPIRLLQENEGWQAGKPG